MKDTYTEQEIQDIYAGLDQGLYERATFAGGCFWCTEAYFLPIKGVLLTQVGYTGGDVENPSYRDVSTGETGHAEVLEIIFDPKMVSYDDLLDIFFEAHDPTQLNRQGPDIGTQYRSAIFYHGEDQRQAARTKMMELEMSKKLSRPIVTDLQPAASFRFFRAEDYHQQYYRKKGVEYPNLQEGGKRKGSY